MVRVASVAAVVAGLVMLAGCASSSTDVVVPSIDPGLVPRGPTVTGVSVDRVVDGDTVRVFLAGKSVSVRLIGINTPETVKPGSEVECFGPEASEFAKDLLSEATVTLEYDDSQGRLDRYDRTLAYVWRELPDGSLRLFNLESVTGGFAYQRQYGSQRYAWQPEFVAAQRSAKAGGAGLWSACEAP